MYATFESTGWELVITTAGMLGGMEERKEVEVESWDEFQNAVEYALKKYNADENTTDFFSVVESGLKEFFNGIEGNLNNE